MFVSMPHFWIALTRKGLNWQIIVLLFHVVYMSDLQLITTFKSQYLLRRDV